MNTHIPVLHDCAACAEPALAIGVWLSRKYQRIALSHGVQHSARLLRKQGVPITVAKLILLGRT